MSTAARKARKKAGIPFSKPAKVGTPPHERFVQDVLKKGVFGVLGMYPSNRAKAKIARRYGPWRKVGDGVYVAPPYTPAPTSPLV